MKHYVLISVLLTLTGCTMGPNYKRPQVAVPGEFRSAPASAQGASLAETKWQELFPDDQLRTIVDAALAKNFDLQMATERIEQARAQYGITRADQFPFLDARAGFTGTHPSTLGANTFVRPGTNLSSAYTSVGLALSWELDLWGRLRRLTESARAQYLASEEARRGLTVSLVSDVMSSYFQLLEQDAELAISRKTQQAARDSLRLVQLRREAGAASGLDVRQAEQLIYTTAAQMAAAERNITQTENALSLLQAVAPTAQTRGRKLEEIPVPDQAQPGMPSALIERRPDIRRAEQSLISANAQIGAARALYFPQISLTALAGGESRSLTSLVTAPARTFSVAPVAMQTVFRAGQVRSTVKLTEAQQRELLIAYQKTIFTALREVSDALAAFDRTREQRNQQEQLVRTLQDTVALSELRYKGGLDSFLQVLDAQRNLYGGELQLAQLRLQERVAVVQLYRALGGGWS